MASHAADLLSTSMTAAITPDPHSEDWPTSDDYVLQSGREAYIRIQSTGQLILIDSEGRIRQLNPNNAGEEAYVFFLEPNNELA